MVRVELFYYSKMKKNYIKISGFKKGEAWSMLENDEVSIFIPADKFEEIRNAKIIDRTTTKKDKISELEKRVSKIEQTLEELKQLLRKEKGN